MSDETPETESASLRQLLKERLDGLVGDVDEGTRTRAQAIIDTMVDDAITGTITERKHARRQILEYLLGKPKTEIESNSHLDVIIHDNVPKG